MTLKMIACEVMKEELLAVSKGLDMELEFISMDFHLYPEKLKGELQGILDRSIGYKRIVLAFGLCGRAIHQLKTADYVLTIPRVHDCIPLLLGSKERFEQCRLEEKGTFYLSCGWALGEASILSSFQRHCHRFGKKKATGILRRMYEGYNRILFIHTGHSREKECLQISHDIAQLLQLSCQTTQGTAEYLEKLVKGPWEGEDFVHVPPYGAVDEMEFIFTT